MRRLASLVWLATVGCVPSPVGSPDPCGHARVEVDVEAPPDASEVDLVLVVDGSPAIAGFRDHAMAQADRIVRVIATGDVDGDGTRELMPAHTLRVAVIDTDMGGPTCGRGDGGGFRTAGCANAPGGVVTYEVPQDPAMFLAAVDCLVGSVGSSASSFDRGMDAMLAARDSIGASFSNPSSVLAFVVIAAEDDCSTEHPEIFARSTPPGLLCHEAASSLRSIDDVASALSALRASPADVFVGIAAGMPPRLSFTDPTGALDAPEETETPDPAMPDRLTPACTTGTSAAYPARRWLSLAAALNARGATAPIVSICSDDFEPILDGYRTFPRDPVFPGLCLPRALHTDAAGGVPCDVFIALPPIGTTFEVEHCAELPSPEAFTLDHLESVAGITREICRVRALAQAEAGRTAGWAYDDGSPELLSGWSQLPAGCTQRIGLSVIGLEPGEELRAGCDEEILLSGRAATQHGTFCDPTTSIPIDCAAATPSLACDPFLRSCQTPCTSDADCPSGLSCDRRDADTFFDGNVPDGIASTAIHAVCFDLDCE